MVPLPTQVWSDSPASFVYKLLTVRRTVFIEGDFIVKSIRTIWCNK